MSTNHNSPQMGCKKIAGRFTHLCVCEKEHCAALSWAIVFVTFMGYSPKKKGKSEKDQLFPGDGPDGVHYYLRHQRQLEGNHPFIRANRKQKGADKKSVCAAGYRGRELHNARRRLLGEWEEQLAGMRPCTWAPELQFEEKWEPKLQWTTKNSTFLSAVVCSLGSPFWCIHHFITYQRYRHYYLQTCQT